MNLGGFGGAGTFILEIPNRCANRKRGTGKIYYTVAIEGLRSGSNKKNST